jgi:hypothetical protein
MRDERGKCPVGTQRDVASTGKVSVGLLDPVLDLAEIALTVVDERGQLRQ